jgi:hypothetical protein
MRTESIDMEKARMAVEGFILGFAGRRHAAGRHRGPGQVIRR